jgi:hypothetical protein
VEGTETLGSPRTNVKVGYYKTPDRRALVGDGCERLEVGSWWVLQGTFWGWGALHQVDKVG